MKKKNFDITHINSYELSVEEEKILCLGPLLDFVKERFADPEYKKAYEDSRRDAA